MEQIIRYLKINEWARERAFRKIAILNNLASDHPWLATLKTKEVTDFVTDYMKLDKYFREVERLYPELRGKDWKDGRTLSQKAQIEFGYQPGHSNYSKELSKIV